MDMPSSPSRNTATASKGIQRGVRKAVRNIQEVGNLSPLLPDETKKKRKGLRSK